MLGLKKISLLVFVCVGIGLSVFFISTHADDSEKAKSVPAVEVKELTRQEKYNGTWSNSRIELGRNTLTLSFTDKNHASLEYTHSDSVHGTPASFKTDLIFDSFGEANFTFENDGWGHSGWGDLFLEGSKLTLYINTHNKKDSSPFGVIERITEFEKVDASAVTGSFTQAITSEIKTFRKGFLPKESMTYRYRSLNGFDHDYEYFTYQDNNKVFGTHDHTQGVYEISRKELTFTPQDGDKTILLQFPAKKDTRWQANDHEVREIVETDYKLYDLSDVVVVKVVTTDKDTQNVSYDYYHEDFGRVAVGTKKVGNITSLLQKIEQKN